jgi:hypothetical protein
MDEPSRSQMKTVSSSQSEQVHRAKVKHKQIALAVHRRATRQTRRKIAWSILNRTEETLACARETLARQIQRCGNLPRYRAWATILNTSPDAIAYELLREDARVQQRNSCHPFGNALSIYETHRPKRPD